MKVILQRALATGMACAASVALAADPGERPAAAPIAWEGALGLITQYRPEYQGADRQTFKVTPALFLRYGRLTVTNASGFVTRRADDVQRGLALDVVRNEHLRVNLALRFDAGRSESSSGALAGQGDIKATVRARLNLSLKGAGDWRIGGSLNTDLLGHKGGSGAEISGGWEHRLDPDTVVLANASVSIADARYMQTYFGVSAAQSALSGYPAYTPGSGLHDATLNFGLRHDFGRSWAVLAGAGASRLLGPAANSPLTARRNGFAVSAGFARRF